MSQAGQRYERYMRHAIELAQLGWGYTHPNPIVGAIIVEGDTVVAEGWHRAAGEDHAEVDALKKLGRKPKLGAELYVTLEPCSTHGRTGACTSAIINAGVAAVVVGARDPNPAHRGRGFDVLSRAGIQVVEGVLEKECADLNLMFNHWILSGEPFIAAKMAITLDGKFAASSGHSQWVTGEQARLDVMRWRRYFPAIAVSAKTALSDNPSLTARREDGVWCPIRFIFDRSLRTLADVESLHLFNDAYSERTIVLCADWAAEEHRERIESLGINIWVLPESNGHLDWQALRNRCVEEGIFGVYVEVGPTLATNVIEHRLADYLFVYQAPNLLSDAAAPGLGSIRKSESMSEVFSLRDIRVEDYGEDRLTRGFIST